MMNLRERRGYLSRMRKDQSACFCPACKRKTRHFAIPSKDEAGACDIVCEYCNEIVVRAANGITPYTVVRVRAHQEGEGTSEDSEGKL